MSIAVTLTAATIVVAVVMVAVARRIRSRRPPSAAHRIEPAGARASDGRGFYAPAFILDPGHCFRLCRDPATGTAHACPGPVEGSGEFADHRGNLVEVEACSVHMIDLGNWRFKTVDG